MTFFDHEPDLTMKTETCLEIQAYLDGELDSRRQKEAAALCDRDPEARALHASLENLRGVLQSHEPVHLVPDSREFYWSQIQKRIAAAERRVNTRS